MGFRITWNDTNLAEEGHRVYRSTSPMDPEDLPAPIAILDPDVELYDDGEVTPGVTYYYRIGAFTAGGTVERVSAEIMLVAEENSMIVDGAEWWFSHDATSVITGDVPDDSGNGYDGTITDLGSFSLEPGLFGNCLERNSDSGSVDRVDIPPLPLATNPAVSLAVWIYWNGAASSFAARGIWGHGNVSNNNCHFEIRGTGATDLRLRLGDYNNNAFPTPPDNEWVMVTFTYDGSTVNIYHNATIVATAGSVTSGEIFGSPATPDFGQQLLNSGERPFLSSRVGAARLYLRALTALEVSQLYDERLAA